MPDHGHLYDNFSRQATHSHGGSYFDSGFGQKAADEAHGLLHDKFGVPRPDAAHGERFDDFGWNSMPVLHGQHFDSDFAAPTAHAGGHGTWFDEFRGGTEVRFMADGADYEGTIVEVNREYATVRSHDGQVREVGLSQFLGYRTPTQQQDGPALPASDAHAPSAHSHDAHGGGARDSALTSEPSTFEHVSEGPGNTDARSGMPAGLMDTFQSLKALADTIDVEKVEHGVVVDGKPDECMHCGTKLAPVKEKLLRDGHPTDARTAACKTCGTEHVGITKSMDATDTAVQRAPSGGAPAKTVGHRNGCPRGGGAPCGSEVDGSCSICKAQVHDHDAVGKASTGALGIDVPERAHPTSDHHMRLGAKPVCPHCGGALDLVDHQTEQGQPNRREKQGGTHKCVGSGLDILKSLVNA